MITTHKQMIDHNLSFFEAVVDAKVDAWKTVSRAYNNYTMHYFKDDVTKADEAVESLGKSMKHVAGLAREGYRG